MDRDPLFDPTVRTAVEVFDHPRFPRFRGDIGVDTLHAEVVRVTHFATNPPVFTAMVEERVLRYVT